MHTKHIVYLASSVTAVERFLCATHLGMFWLIAKLSARKYARNREADRGFYWAEFESG